MTDTKDQSSIQVIQVQSRFSRLARRGGGIAATEAIAAAEAFVETERSRYYEWVTKDLLDLDLMLGVLFENDERASERYEAAYYKTAQIRDLGGTFGHQIITDVAHCFCELLYRLKMAGTYNQEAIETHRAALKLVCGLDFASMPEATGPMLLQGLNQVVEKFPAPQLPPT